jgi:hypothetical protein
MPLIDLTGEKYGRLFVVNRDKTINKRPRWKCLCDCGTEKIVDGAELRKNSTQSCGCLKKEMAKEKAKNLRFKDLSDKRFGRLVVLNRAGTAKYKQSTWNCVCDCGTKKVIASQALLQGLTQSCGCLHKEIMVSVGINGRIYYDVESAPKSMKRVVKQYVQTPKWANKEKIKQFYKQKPKGYEVDHIIPLQGKFVSGLHVENNLQYLSKIDNVRKSNKFFGE